MAQITFSGLATGLDTNSIIEQIIKLERNPLEQDQARVDHLESLKDVWRSINSRIKSLGDAAMSLRMSSTYFSHSVSSSNKDVLTTSLRGVSEEGTYQIEVQQLAQAHAIAMGDQGDNLIIDPDEALNLKGSFSINGTKVNLLAGDSLRDLAQKIKVVENMTASVVRQSPEGDYRLIIRSEITGKAGELQMEDLSGNVLHDLRIYDNETGFINQICVAQNAVLIVDGFQVERSSNAVEDVIPGVILNLHQTSSDQKVNVEVGKDVDRALNAIKDFVEAYNAANLEIRQRLARDGGELQGDSTLMRIERQLRSLMHGRISGLPTEYDSLASLGIMADDEKGFLQIKSEEELRHILQKDPQAVMNQFCYHEGESKIGLAVQVDNMVSQITRTHGVIPTAEDSLQHRINDMNRRIERMEQRLERREEEMLRQFIVMERAISTMQSQSDYLITQINQLFGFSSRGN